ncbi:hypothetical protein GQ44DRAFT_716700 [Phaeosphaeriaceae sp. PMI808]|nr:hypothetical protein GQ44DRAFT_716700 [Phaeosphaeriaceae sp. PMI808]
MAKLDDILSPIKITYLATEVVTRVAGESEESRAKRKQLANQLNVLIKGSETCKKFMVGTLPGTFNIV